MTAPSRKRFRFNLRVAAVALHDVVMAVLSFEAALGFRYWLADIPFEFFQRWEGTLIFAAVAAVVFQAMGLYRGIWHYASMRDMTAIMRAAALAILVFLPLMFWATRLSDFPRSALVIQYFFLVAMLAGPRLLYRSWREGSLVLALKRGVDPRVPVLLIGTGPATDAFIREMQRNPQSGYRVTGILDAKPSRQGRDIRGVRVLGGLGDLESVVRSVPPGDRPHRVVVADAGIAGTEMGELLERAAALGMTVARLPRLTDFQREGAAAGSPNIRPIDVEDLLGRPQKVLDRAAVQRLVRGRRVLVTGAGGTIGSELVRQIAELEPAEVALFEQSEFALYQIDMELAERWPGLKRAALLGDVRDAARVAEVFEKVQPGIVLHAAAYKHVPLTEQNPAEAVLTNVIGTQLVIEAALRHGVAVMVLISTDKAVNPTNVMGATKRVAEMVAQNVDLRGGPTHFVTVRFGNVLGSSGSVVPLFQRQLAQGGPLTVTHPEVTRYFMTTREAVELILQAAALPTGELHAEGKIFVLDMGDPVRILDLARQMIRLAGLKPETDVKIVFTGLRPGEKLYEEVLHHAETPVPTPLDGVLLAAPRVHDPAELQAALNALAAAAVRRDSQAILQVMRDLIPEFRHAPDGQDKANTEPAAAASAA